MWQGRKTIYNKLLAETLIQHVDYEDFGGATPGKVTVKYKKALVFPVNLNTNLQGRKPYKT